MRVTADIASVRAIVQSWRKEGARVALVPTMGNLHAGHYSLLERARKVADRVVASIFVNPTQFGPNEDFARYPRTLEADRAGLAARNCDCLFVPDVSTVYPFGAAQATRVSVPGLTAMLDGAARPGHFDGVTSVVARLFHLVEPDVAVFGQKDFQQLRVIERMTADLHLPIEILGAPIVREEDGLALSSRNQYLTPEERQRAPVLHATLAWMRERHHAGDARDALEAGAMARLHDAGFAPDYAVIRRSADLADPAPDDRDALVALVAARLGSTRLIDNLLFD